MKYYAWNGYFYYSISETDFYFLNLKCSLYGIKKFMAENNQLTIHIKLK